MSSLIYQIHSAGMVQSREASSEACIFFRWRGEDAYCLSLLHVTVFRFLSRHFSISTTRPSTLCSDRSRIFQTSMIRSQLCQLFGTIAHTIHHTQFPWFGVKRISDVIIYSAFARFSPYFTYGRRFIAPIRLLVYWSLLVSTRP